MVVNVATRNFFNIKVDTLFRGRMYFVREAENSTRGRKYFLLGRANISSPGDFVMGKTLFGDTGTATICTGHKYKQLVYHKCL